ncbi:MAG: dimethyladenosine transferase [Pseudomonadota bacterium]|jgi:16S rRNA (adenine1518-N6/adenine1519-N6)-dimethyltransferase
MSTAPHRARKRFGQNFLHDQNIIGRIVRAIAPGPGQTLIEIGPGQGAITGPLLDATDQLTAIEIDRDLAAALRVRFAARPGFRLIEQDVLKVNFAELGSGSSAGRSAPDSLRILGNLPYNISTPLLFHLLEYRDLIHDMVFMLQLEVVDRMAALPGTPDYGRLSVMMQYHCKVEKLFTVPPGAFSPQPKVDSAIVKLTPWRPLPHPARNPDTLGRVVRTAFSQRRKTLRNTLKTLLLPEYLEASGIDLSLRPENIGLRDYVRISDLVDQHSDSFLE